MVTVKRTKSSVSAGRRYKNENVTQSVTLSLPPLLFSMSSKAPVSPYADAGPPPPSPSLSLSTPCLLPTLVSGGFVFTCLGRGGRGEGGGANHSHPQRDTELTGKPECCTTGIHFQKASLEHLPQVLAGGGSWSHELSLPCGPSSREGVCLTRGLWGPSGGP